MDIKLYLEALTNLVLENVKRQARIGDKRRNTGREKRTVSRYESVVKFVVKKYLKKKWTRFIWFSVETRGGVL